MEDDRKATLEAAFEAAEAGLSNEPAIETAVVKDVINDVKESVATETPTTVAETAEKMEVATSAPTEVAAEVTESAKQVNLDRAPQSWKPAQKAKWASLDPDIRQEVLRRDHETMRVLNDTTQARQFTSQFHQAIQPYMARIQQVGDPVKAVANLLAADHLLATGPKAQKAQYLAKLITEYGVDIQELDAALAGKQSANPVESQVEQLLQQRLAPIQQFLTQQQQEQVRQQQLAQQQVATTVEQMSMDPTYPHFDAVRETMADLIELSARKGVSIDLKTAYNRAVAMDPTISQEVANTAATEQQRQQAALHNGKAQRALAASASVGGAPTGSISGQPNVSDRRAVLEAAFESAGGR